MLVKYIKLQPICEIPGFRYGNYCANSLKKPWQWFNEFLHLDTLRYISLRPIGAGQIVNAADPRLVFKVTRRNPHWLAVKQFIDDHDIQSYDERQLEALLPAGAATKNQWKRQIQKHILHRRTRAGRQEKHSESRVRNGLRRLARRDRLQAAKAGQCPRREHRNQIE